MLIILIFFFHLFLIVLFIRSRDFTNLFITDVDEKLRRKRRQFHGVDQRIEKHGKDGQRTGEAAGTIGYGGADRQADARSRSSSSSRRATSWQREMKMKSMMMTKMMTKKMNLKKFTSIY